MFNHFGLIIVFFISEFSQSLSQIRHFWLELHFYRLNQFINSRDLFIFCRCKSPVGEEKKILSESCYLQSTVTSTEHQANRNVTVIVWYQIENWMGCAVASYILLKCL